MQTKEKKGRVIGFTKKWDKLYTPEFTTFRFKRKDKPLEVGELVQIVYHPRSKDREIIGKALIKRIDAYCFRPTIGYLYPSDEDAIADGFDGLDEMIDWFTDTYGERINQETMFKITLKRIFQK